MADSTLSALPAAAALSGPELFYGVQSAADVKVTATQLRTFAATGLATLGANTFTALQTITQASANAGILASTGYSLTGSDATNMIDLAGTWNTSGNPIALKIAITNTASGATSKFVSFLAGAGGATAVFSVDKAGIVAAAGAIGTSAAGTLDSTAAISLFAAGRGLVASNGGVVVQSEAGASGPHFGADASTRFGVWSSTAVTQSIAIGSSATTDVFLTRKGAANFQFGLLDAAAPVAQTLSVQSVVAGTSNTAGADTNITGSLSTGSGIAGKIVFNLSQIVAAATTQNASSSVLSLNTIAASGIQFPRYGAGALSTDASGNITATSDERLKHVTGHFKAGLAELMKIDPIVFKWREDSGMETAHEYVGFGAHNVQESMPEAVGQTPDGYLTLSDRALLAACVNAIKDLSGRVHK